MMRKIEEIDRLRAINADLHDRIDRLLEAAEHVASDLRREAAENESIAVFGIVLAEHLEEAITKTKQS